jgi:hypothetical protein
MPKYVSTTGREVWCTRGQMRRMDHLPYGKWICEDGREVLFNRFYEPIYQRHLGATAQPADRKEWVPWKRQEWFYDDTYSERRAIKVATAILTKWGVQE